VMLPHHRVDDSLLTRTQRCDAEDVPQNSVDWFPARLHRALSCSLWSSQQAAIPVHRRFISVCAAPERAPSHTAPARPFRLWLVGTPVFVVW